MEMIMTYIVEEALIVIAALLVIGAILKGTPVVADWWIPWILLVLGVASTMALLGFSVGSVIQGVLVTGGAVFVHQLVKQTKNQN